MAWHRFGLYRNQSAEIVGRLQIEEEPLADEVLVNVRREFMEPIPVAHGADDIDVIPIPVELAGAFPFVPALIRSAGVGGSAGQVAIRWPEFSNDEPLEDEFIQVGGLREGGECPPWRRLLILEGEVKPARLLITYVLILNQDTGDVAADVTLHSFAGQ